jgi:signal transduction histidine kinase
MTSGSTDLAQFVACIADIARTLEAPHEAQTRLRHVLGLVRGVIPCDRCALHVPALGEPATITMPDVAAGDAARLEAFLRDILQFMEGASTDRTIDSRAHLALPVIGLDEIIGVLLVDRADGQQYEPHHLRFLSAVSSQLGAYLTMVRLHHETARQTRLLADREHQLRGAARFREEFIGVIGHDLRNPLSAIRAAAQLLVKRAPLDAPDVALVERVERSADRMSHMIDELMDFARGRLGGGVPLRRTLVDLHALCRDVVEEAQTAHGRTVQLVTSGDPCGHWDQARLAQLMSNLVGNALHHSPPDAFVRVVARDDGEYALAEVANGGTPIPAEQLERIFEPFHRADNTAAPGLGLGLYIVERIVKAHGGTIDVRSTPGDGTIFSVRLPRRRANDRIE